jgi:hypothetical protein
MPPGSTPVLERLQYMPALQRWGDPNKISWACWDGKHNRCDGWLVVPGSSGPADLSVRCACPECHHPLVASDRHHHEPVQKGILWSALTTTPW